MPEDAERFTRRALLTTGAVAALGGAVWFAADRGIHIGDVVDDLSEGLDGLERPQPGASVTPVPASDLTAYDRIAGSRLHYEASGAPSSFRMGSGFAEKLDASLTSHWQATRWGVPSQVWSYGTWVDLDARPRPSWHHEGRAFDLTSVRTSDDDVLVSCRYDRWGGTSGPERADHEREYWRLAATLLRDFGTVLTYLFDEAHHDHIHVDDGRTPEGRSEFRRTRTQVHGVQAICTHVWGVDVPITGRWDARTREATTGVLADLGVGGRLTQGQKQWHAFLGAAAGYSP
ncbi:hypothetical protein [Mobilicoccus caccae]|uniref:Extensin-like C-terminal domain-containing protein n=1 Tax=Mobilicoccus caccae TaxID=1859295 RepID=A0ABQ6ISB8_9MICO|nr:hypothetical protein [Mobilicoccus caccae]GMA39614.1 hypothetical protein GCM10025883_16590 [Mobilicoccus caccae]